MPKIGISTREEIDAFISEFIEKRNATCVSLTLDGVVLQYDADTERTVKNDGFVLLKEDDEMTNDKFENLVKKTVADYTNEQVGNEAVFPEDVYIVWMCKTLQNHKALASTPIPNGMYYELTYNGDKRELYVDAYKKQDNYCVKCNE